MKKFFPTFLFISLLSITACNKGNTSSFSNAVSDSKVSSYSSNKSTSSISSNTIKKLQLSNNDGLVVDFSTRGARISSIKLDGKSIAQNGFIAGRVANRIAGGSFTLDGKTYSLNKNEGNNTLHGGSRGFGEVDWQVVEQTDELIKFHLTSQDGDMGFPGKMEVYTTYSLNDDGELSFEIEATCDKKTIFNPINHLYMNLNGNTSVSNHSLWIDADKYLATDYSKLPTGTLNDVSSKNSLNYQSMKSYISGNDHCLVLKGEGYRKVAELSGNSTGYLMELYTDRVALQLYDDGQRICLEAQDYIDAIHHSEFPSIVLEANETWHSKSAYCFTKTK